MKNTQEVRTQNCPTDKGHPMYFAYDHSTNYQTSISLKRCADYIFIDKTLIFSFFANLDFIDNTLQLKNFIKWGLSSLYDANEMILSKDNLVKLLSDFLGNDILLDDDQILNRGIKEARESFEIKYLKYNLEKFKKNVSKMSKKIGMERTALHRKLKSLDIQLD